MERTLVIDHSTSIIRRAGAVVLGALLVAGAAQVSVPLPGTPVPMTLQPMAVLLVAGLLGPQLGALSMILYLAMGAAGLPVFTPTVPLMARVSFADAKRVGIALGWVVLFYIVAFGVVYVLTQLLPARWNDTLAFDPIALIESAGLEVIGLGLATYLFGRLINTHSWS